MKKNSNIDQSNNKNVANEKAQDKGDALKVWVVTSPEPLPDEMKKYNKLYFVCILCCLGGILYEPLLGVGILGFLAVYCFFTGLCDHKNNKLRLAKFQFVPNINDEELFIKSQPVFISKYNWSVEKNNAGSMVVKYKKYSFDISINEDNTFGIWWRIPGAKALIPIGNYKLYKEIIAAMGIIAYEIQNVYGISNEQKNYYI